MQSRTPTLISAVIVVLTAGSSASRSQTTEPAPAGRPEAIIDLTTTEGVRMVEGQWRYSDAKIVEVDHRAIGPDFKPSGPPNRTHDIDPKAGAADFDDSKWETIEPPRPEHRRSTGRLSFGWFRICIPPSPATAAAT